MSDKSKIEWTDATWNPITGCSIVSKGCTNCYAMKMAGTRLKHHWSREGLTDMTKAGPVWNGKVRFNERWLTQPLHWTKPRRIFVCAHGDLFHGAVSSWEIDQIFAVMALCPQHTFQILTKRPERMRTYFNDTFYTDVDGEDLMARERVARWAHSLANPEGHKDDCAGYGERIGGQIEWPLKNVWLGVSVEDQETAYERIPLLLDTPAAVRWISAEPLLGKIDLIEMDMDKLLKLPPDDTGRRPRHTYNALLGRSDIPPIHGAEPDWSKIDWVVVGAESGPKARSCDIQWVRHIKNQCVSTAVPFFWKQEVKNGRKIPTPELDGRKWVQYPN